MKHFNTLLIGAALLIGLSGIVQAAQTGTYERTRDAYAPFEELIQVIASDAVTYDPPLRGCIVEVEGDMAVTTPKGDADVTITVIAGQLIPAQISVLKSTGTTATVICGR